MKGNHKANGAVVYLRFAAVNPVVFTASVALPAPVVRMSNDEGFTLHEGEDAEAGKTEQLRLTVSLNPFKGAIAMPATPWPPTGTVPSDGGLIVIVKSAVGGGALLGKKMYWTVWFEFITTRHCPEPWQVGFGGICDQL